MYPCFTSHTQEKCPYSLGLDKVRLLARTIIGQVSLVNSITNVPMQREKLKMKIKETIPAFSRFDNVIALKQARTKRKL